MQCHANSTTMPTIALVTEERTCSGHTKQPMPGTVLDGATCSSADPVTALLHWLRLRHAAGDSGESIRGESGGLPRHQVRSCMHAVTRCHCLTVHRPPHRETDEFLQLLRNPASFGVDQHG